MDGEVGRFEFSTHNVVNENAETQRFVSLPRVFEKIHTKIISAAPLNPEIAQFGPLEKKDESKCPHRVRCQPKFLPLVF